MLFFYIFFISLILAILIVSLSIVNKEELLLGTDVIVLEAGCVKANKKTKDILKDEKLIASVGMQLPFIISMSNGCKLYELTNKMHYDIKSLVGALWK